MTTYDLYVESGPRHRTTMVHVPQLLGCVVVGRTTAETLEATPDVIEKFLRLLRRHGESKGIDEKIEVRVADQTTEGLMLLLPTDLVPLPDDGIERALAQVRWITDELGSWTAAQPQTALDEKSELGWPPMKIVLHVLGSLGFYLESAFGSGPEIDPIRRKAARAEISLEIALQETVALCSEQVANATPEQRTGVRQLEWGQYTLHRAMRRMNEHAWEHLVELSRRPGGPVL